jgi:hypothetical protein
MFVQKCQWAASVNACSVNNPMVSLSALTLNMSRGQLFWHGGYRQAFLLLGHGLQHSITQFDSFVGRLAESALADEKSWLSKLARGIITHNLCNVSRSTHPHSSRPSPFIVKM